VRGLQPLPARQAEKGLRGLQRLPPREDKTALRGLQPLPSREGEKQVLSVQPLPSREAEKELRGLHPLPSWQGEKELRGVHPLPLLEGEKELRGLHPLPAREAETGLQGVQPVPPRQAETELRGVQPLPPREAEKELRGMQGSTRDEKRIDDYIHNPSLWLYRLSRISSELPWNGSRNTGIAAVLFPMRITSREVVVSTIEVGSIWPVSVRLASPPRFRKAYGWYFALFFETTLCARRSHSKRKSRKKSMRSSGSQYVKHK
jgi:hypothetical protein